MKQILLVFAILNFIVINLNGQCLKATNLTGKTGIIWQYSAHFVDTNTIIVAGNGNIKRSTNGGLNYSNVTFNGTFLSKNFRAMSFPLSYIGFVAGGSGIVAKTIDAGSTWQDISAPTTETLKACYFINSDTGYVGGNNGAAFYTYNGGLLWDSFPTLPKVHTWTSVWFKNTKEGFFLGTGGGFYRTEDGGASWISMMSGIDTMMSSICFPTKDTGFAGGNYGIIKKTVDGGKTWKNQKSNFLGAFWGMDYLNSNIIMAAGSEGKTFRTEDGGETWYCTNHNLNVTNQEARGIDIFNDKFAISAHVGSVAVKFQMIYSEPKPVLTVSGNQLTAPSATTYKWFYNGILGTETSSKITALPIGRYNVLTETNQCYSISNSIIDLTTNTNLLLENNQNTLVYPTITNAIIHIKTVDFNNNVTVFNCNGIEILNVKNVNILDIGNLEKGVYFIRIKNNIEIFKIIKK